MIKKSCANKLPDTRTVPCEDIAEHNHALGIPRNNENKNDFERGTFERAELLCGRIKVTNQAEWVVWECNMCAKTTDAKQKIRNHLSAVHRKTNTGKLYFPYCEKENIHIGNLKARITGFSGRKCKKVPIGKTGPEIWEEIIERNPRQD